MLKIVSVVLSVVVTSTTAWAGTASNQYNALKCEVNLNDMENRIAASLSTNREALNRRMALLGFKGEKLSELVDITVECSNSTKKSYEANNRVLVQGFAMVNSNLCRLQFSTNNETTALDFEYMNCVSIPSNK